jgi:hypothetical protein
MLNLTLDAKLLLRTIALYLFVMTETETSVQWDVKFWLVMPVHLSVLVSCIVIQKLEQCYRGNYIMCESLFSW